jgi:hypothetical protein
VRGYICWATQQKDSYGYKSPRVRSVPIGNDQPCTCCPQAAAEPGALTRSGSNTEAGGLGLSPLVDDDDKSCELEPSR